MGRPRTPAIDLVRRRMASVSPGPGGCTEWPGAQAGPGHKEGKGYGIVGRTQKGPERVNRVVLEAKLGRPLRPGMYACHTCDNPPCCAEDHLFEGTQKQNLLDAVAKGRTSVGEAVASSVLTEAQVLAILADSRANKVVARDYGVQSEAIRRIRKGQTWKHLSRV